MINLPINTKWDWGPKLEWNKKTEIDEKPVTTEESALTEEEVKLAVSNTAQNGLWLISNIEG